MFNNNMNQKFSTKAIQRGLWVGAMLLSAAAAYAQTQVTFQVDMTEQIGSTFNPPGDTVSVHGTFNGWGAGFTLTNNPAAANPNLYTGTVTDTSDANGSVLIFKYVIDSGTYENTEDGQNRCAQLPAGGGSLQLPAPFFDDAGPTITANVTFQVNMAEQVNLGVFNTNTGSTVEVHGFFNGWASGDTLTNDTSILTTNGSGIVTSNVYVGTFAVTGSTNGTQEYKYVTQPNTVYEGPSTNDSDYDNGENRFYVTSTQTLPIVLWSDVPLAVTVTNNITFEVDMTALLISGAFTTNETVTLNGDFNNWTGQAMSNNPASSTPNVYATTVTIVDAAGAAHAFKFVENGTYESLANNRVVDLLDKNGSFTNGPFYFNNQVPVGADFLTTNCMVTFTVNMTNAVGVGVGTGIVFDNTYPSSDTVWINGLLNGLNNNFWTWAQAPFPGGQSGYQMTQIPNTMLFTITLPVNKGQSADLIYKYSLDGYDNEAGFADNHERWVRSQPNYTMPVDTFGSQGAATQSEISFGNLAITNLNNAQIQLSWLGRNGVELQTTSNLNAAVWTSQPLTDGTNLTVAPGGEASTNYTIGQGNLFYRLIGPQ
jgi:hypothetical protein